MIFGGLLVEKYLKRESTNSDEKTFVKNETVLRKTDSVNRWRTIEQRWFVNWWISESNEKKFVCILPGAVKCPRNSFSSKDRVKFSVDSIVRLIYRWIDWRALRFDQGSLKRLDRVNMHILSHYLSHRLWFMKNNFMGLAARCSSVFAVDLDRPASSWFNWTNSKRILSLKTNES